MRNQLNSLMREALEVAKRSKDAQTKVGAVLVAKDDNSTIATGYNGFIRGAPDHLLPTTRPEKYKFIKHSEENLIANCARRGIATKDTYVVITMSPCINCLRLLWQAGIDTIYFLEEYKDFQDSIKMSDLEVDVKKMITNDFKISKITLSTVSIRK